MLDDGDDVNVSVEMKLGGISCVCCSVEVKGLSAVAHGSQTEGANSHFIPAAALRLFRLMFAEVFLSLTPQSRNEAVVCR